jgi:hypothetical protein
VKKIKQYKNIGDLVEKIKNKLRKLGIIVSEDRVRRILRENNVY